IESECGEETAARCAVDGLLDAHWSVPRYRRTGWPTCRTNPVGWVWKADLVNVAVQQYN
ncbi:hypothetical protein CTAM01_11967, partial [Colletotrichum tamarilloi]